MTLRRLGMLAGAALVVLAASAAVFYRAHVPEEKEITVLRAPYVPAPAPVPAAGPLRVLDSNPRYLTADGRTAVLLVGSHTWTNLVDAGYDDPPPRFDYDRYLDLLSRQNHNFFRLWAWEQACWAPWVTPKYHFDPVPYERTGPGLALDGKPKFDLDRPNAAYFERVRERVGKAGDRGIYVSVMLFDGWSLDNKGWIPGNGWPGHPFHASNNVNGIDGDRDGDGGGAECHTLGDPRITAYQERYVARVVDAVNHLDNVLYEISNESTPDSRGWQVHMIDFVRRCEASKTKRHPVGMTSCIGLGNPGNADLFDSGADWVSPNNGLADEFAEGPPPATGRKVVVLDTDHIWGIGGTRDWAWKAFLRGYHVLFMDGWDGRAVGCGAPAEWDIRHAGWKEIVKKVLGMYEPTPAWDPNDRTWVELRAALGDIAGFARRVPLARMTPRGDLTSSGYCLAGGGRGSEHLLAYAAGDTDVATVDLSEIPGPLTVERFDTADGVIVSRSRIDGGGPRQLDTPAGRSSILHVFSDRNPR